MRVLLVPALDVRGGRPKPYVPYGLLSLQAVAAGYRTPVDILRPPWGAARVKFASVEDLGNAMLDGVDLGGVDVVGFSTTTSSFIYAVALADLVRRRAPAKPIMFGGPYVTKLAQQVLEDFPVVDAVFVGEAERSFAKFLTRCDDGIVDFAGIPGVVTREGSSCAGETIDDLDRLPSILAARDYRAWFEIRSPVANQSTPIPLEATRGCPLQCSFCSTRQVWGARVRRKSAARLVEEMTQLSALCGGSTFFNLIGDNIGVPRAPFLEFCDELAAINPGFTWGCSLKLDRLEQDHLRRMWAAGMRAMFVGLESGNQETLDKVRKKTNIGKEIDNIRSAVEIGYRVTTSFIVGFPWEDHGDIQATYLLHCELIKAGVERSQVNILCPIPGTDIVAEGKVLFEPWWFEATRDGVTSTAEMVDATTRHPALFSHYGRYETPRITPSELVTIRRSSEIFARMNRGQARQDWNVF